MSLWLQTITESSDSVISKINNGGFISNPLVTDIIDEQLFARLKAAGLKDADARHLMYAAANGCDRFVTLDPDFLNGREVLQAHCQGLRIVRPSELVAELSGV